MHFGNFRDNSVKIGNGRIIGCLPINVGCIPLAVVIMTTANGMHPASSGRPANIFDQNSICYDTNRLLMEFAEVNQIHVALNVTSSAKRELIAEETVSS